MQKMDGSAATALIDTADPIVDAAHAAPLDTIEQYRDIIGQVWAAAVAYYTTDELVMDDATYDALMARLVATEVAHPDWKTAESPTETVAAGANIGGDVPHTTPMLSLDNVFTDKELRTWGVRLEKVLGRAVSAYTVEPKIDGMAISARYEDGVLVRVVTRGDGRSGEDVTAQSRLASGLPRVLSEPATVEIRGEVFMTDDNFAQANELRIANGGVAFANPRNATAGSLRAVNRTYDVPLSFLAYGVHGLDTGAPMTHSQAMAYIAELGVSTTAQSAAGMPVCADVDAVVAAVIRLGSRRHQLGFAVDGAVVKTDSPQDRDDAGSSNRAPRWGIAFKYPPDTRTTKLLDVEWQIGRTGVITPRAVLEPVHVSGTKISFATLHNPDDLARRNVWPGDMVFVRRAGEVIPEITGPMLDARAADAVPFVPPAVCPNCDSDIDRSQKRWRCTRGRLCLAAKSLIYAVSRDALDIDGVGERLIEALVESGTVLDLADLFDLDGVTLAAMERMGDKSASKVVANLAAAKAQPLSRVLTALGVRMTGRSMSRRLARHFGSMQALRDATYEQLLEVDGVGPERAATYQEEMGELAELIDRLVERGVNMLEPQTPVPAVSADGGDAPSLPLVLQDGTPMTVVVSGSVPGIRSRSEANEVVEQLGGKPSGSVSKKTNLLVAGDGAGSKVAKAKQDGVHIMDADVFAKLVVAFRAGESDRVAELLAS